MAGPVATISRPANKGETLRGKQKEKDVRMSNIIAAKGKKIPVLSPPSRHPPLSFPFFLFISFTNFVYFSTK
jgi:hypothetical protein